MGAVWEQQAKTPKKGIFSIAAIQIERFKGQIVATPPVQIWVLASFDAKSAVSFISPDAGTDRVFDNADSFAMVFDRTWKQLRSNESGEVSQDSHLEKVLSAMADHPFLISSPEMARQVAAFRIRLLELA